MGALAPSGKQRAFFRDTGETTMRRYRRDAFGPGNKFITPMIVNGRVYVGTQSGVAVFGMMNQPPLPPTNLRIVL